MGLSPDVRYSVCLMARTSGSRDAWVMKASTDVGEALVGVVDQDVALPDGGEHDRAVRRRRVASRAA